MSATPVNASATGLVRFDAPAAAGDVWRGEMGCAELMQPC